MENGRDRSWLWPTARVRRCGRANTKSGMRVRLLYERSRTRSCFIPAISAGTSVRPWWLRSSFRRFGEIMGMR